MKKAYETPIAEKLAFCYRDQVVAASGTDTGGASAGGSTTGNEGGNSLVENSIGIGSPVCGSGGIVDRVLDVFGICD